MYQQMYRTGARARIRTRPLVLGRPQAEPDRQVSLARFFGDLTRSLLEQAGLGPGMTVLDVGCGAGDAALLAAQIVGPHGCVIGVDTAPEAVARASQRAAQAGLANVHFQVGDANLLNLPEAVDALIGRMILMHLSDPAVALRRLARLVKSGGLVIFQELHLAAARSEPACPLFEGALSRLRAACHRIGADADLGLRLGQTYEEAGLPAPRLTLGARVERGPHSPIYDQVAQLTRALLPQMERAGVATAAEIGVDTLAARLRAEAVRRNATLVSPALIGAWTRV